MFQLGEYLNSIDDNIPLFHVYINQQISALAARGNHDMDMLPYLFRAYQAVDEPTFQAYIVTQRNAYTDTAADFTAKILMARAETQYKSLVQEKLWKQGSSKDARFVALTAQVASLKKLVKKSQGTATDLSLIHI